MEESLEGNYLVLSCTLSIGNNTINAYFMIDCSASGKPSFCSLMEESLEGDYLVLSCTLSNGNNTINVYFMIDGSASGKAFINSSFMQFHKIPLHPLCQPPTVTVVDSCIISSGVIIHFVCILLVIDNYIETTNMFVTKLDQYPVILGILWLQLYNLHMYWKANTLTFNLMHCFSYCLTTSKSITIHGLSVIPELLPSYAHLSARVLLSIPLNMKISEDLRQSTLDITVISIAPFNLWVRCYLMEDFAILLT